MPRTWHRWIPAAAAPVAIGAVVLGGVSRYIARVKCAMLAWVALEDAMAKSPAA